MATFKIVPGGVYAKANEVFAREVIEITSNGNVIYNDYGLSVGAPIGQSFRCSLSRFVTWAARPLTPEEISKLRRKRGQTARPGNGGGHHPHCTRSCVRRANTR